MGSSSKCRALKSAVIKYGRENFSMTILEMLPVADLPKAEMKWIEHYDSYKGKGYNLTVGGEVSPLADPKVRERINDMNKDEVFRKMKRSAIKQSRSTITSKSRTSKASKAMWEKDGHWEKMSAIRKTTWATPGHKEQHAEAIALGFSTKRAERGQSEDLIRSTKTKSGYEGVYKHSNKYRAIYTTGPKAARTTVSLGSFNTAAEAALAYSNHVRATAQTSSASSSARPRSSLPRQGWG